MNEELQKEVLEIIKSSKGFVVSQMPEAVQQYLGILFLDNCAFCIVSMLLFVFFVWVAMIRSKNPYADGLASICVYFMAFVCFITFACSICSAIQIKIYPKGVLLEKMVNK